MSSRVSTTRFEIPRRLGCSWQYIALLVAALTGCDFPGRPNPADRPVPSDQVLSFDILFHEQCSGCHGANGQFGPAPPLNDPLFLAIVPADELRRTILRGRSGTPMPAFARNRGGPLTEAQVDVLAAGLKPRWGRATLAKELLPPYAFEAPTGDSMAKSTVRGKEIFARACAKCHGSQGQGEDRGAGAINDPSFLALVSDQALRRLIITGRPDLGMPSFNDKAGRQADLKPLKSDEIDDLVALLASWRRGTAAAKPSAESNADASRPSPSN